MPKTPITDIDQSNTDPKYWENILLSHDLSLERGSRPRIWVNRGTPIERREDRVVSVGTSKNLTDMEEMTARKDVPGGKRVSPEGHRPD